MFTEELQKESYETVDKQKRYEQIIEILTSYGPSTAKEIAVMMCSKGYIPTTERNFVSPRITELQKKNIVEIVGKKKCQFTNKTVSIFKLLKNAVVQSKYK